MAKRADKTKWIWIARQRHAEDFYLRARRRFALAGKPVRAHLAVTALSDYVLYVNGRYVGRGPAPSRAGAPLLDVYTEAGLPLARGANVIAVLAHNDHVGRPRRPRVPAGLWLRLEVTYASGKTETVGTDSEWRVAPAEDFSGRAPRLFWTAGFAEVRDMRREPPGWTGVRFADRRWARADDVTRGLPETGRLPVPQPRTTPRLAETFVAPVRVVSSDRLAWPPGLTAIPFEFAAPSPVHGEFYAGTFVRAARPGKMRLAFDCDEAAAVYLNNRQVLRQGYSDAFVRWLEDEEHDHYTNIHRGQGYRTEAAAVTLGPGWNSLGVVIYDPAAAWGFAARFEDPVTGRTLPVEFSPDLASGSMAHWHVVIEQLCPCGKGSLPDTPAPNARTFPDPAYQLAWEKRAAARPPRGAASLLAAPRGKGPLRLGDGRTVAFDFADECIGYLEVDVTAAPGAMLDIAWAEGLGPDGRIEPVRAGMRQVDRLILGGGRQTVRLVNRRAFRYVELVARTGGGDVAVHRLGAYATGRPAGAAAAFETSDCRLAGALAIAERTARVCLQDTFEGSPAREAEQSLPAAYLLAQAERTLFGRTDLGEAALRAFAADQRPDGFFRSIAPSGTGHAVPDWNLLWVLWLAEHVAWTGDRALAAELYPAAVKCLEWTAGHRGSSGLLENRSPGPPWWLFVDASPVAKAGEVTAWQALYARALGAEAALAALVGDDEAAGHARAEADDVARLARERLWDDRRGLFVDARHYDTPSPGASAATNYYALYGGLATDAQAARILAALWKNDRTESAAWGDRENPYVKYFALAALLERGQTARALAMIRSYWGAMAAAGLVTVPELFPVPVGRAGGRRRGQPSDGPYDRPPPAVLCHGWGVHPAALVATWVLGVRPGGPGFEPLLLAPMPGDLKRIRGRAWTPRGPVEVAIRPVRGRRKVLATLPADLPYRIDRRHLAEGDKVEVSGGRAVE